MALSDEERVSVVRKALALYFECDEEELGNYVIGVERHGPTGAMFSGAWSAIPHWYLFGMIDELRAMMEKNRSGAQADGVEIPTATPEGLEALLRGTRGA